MVWRSPLWDASGYAEESRQFVKALAMGNRTLMMNAGEIVLDLKGKEREGLTVQDLLERFREPAP